MHLVLGTSPQQRTGYERPDLGVPGPTRSLFDRIPGIPLHSATDQIVGSLHPDNVDLLGPPGSKIECLIVSRCTTPTVASALQPTDTEAARDEEKDRPWDLFWVLVVAWLDGIAERRGVAQVLTSALETAVEPAPEVKLVLLG